MSKKLYEDFKNQMQKIADVSYATAVLGWDQETHLPAKGATHRSQQIATLSGIAHDMYTSESLGALINELKSTDGLSVAQAKNVKLAAEDYEMSKKYTTDFVIKSSQATSKAFHSWVKAREANDFKIFEENLAALVELKQEETKILGYKDHPYDALLNLYEPKAKTAEIDTLFENVKKELVGLVGQIKKKPQVNNDFLFKTFDKDKQWNFGLDLLKNMGYDFDAGRQDVSAHPFTTSFSPQDVRVTTRVDENDLGNMTWSCIHEGGHALYEQGLPASQYGLPLSQAVSLGIHESQSRLWENNVGRSLPYWKAHFGKLSATFPTQLAGVSVEDFYKGINRIAPNLIRTEADELHYHFHVLIRFELEKEMLTGALKVADLEKAWNERYEHYLGVKPSKSSEGVLQDIHWSHGSFGYFPTYSLGSFYAAQLFEKASEDISGLSGQIALGDNQALLDWLRHHIHQHGRAFTAAEQCEMATGEKLDLKYFMKYARNKYGEIYGL